MHKGVPAPQLLPLPIHLPLPLILLPPIRFVPLQMTGQWSPMLQGVQVPSPIPGPMVVQEPPFLPLVEALILLPLLITMDVLSPLLKPLPLPRLLRFPLPVPTLSVLLLLMAMPQLPGQGEQVHLPMHGRTGELELLSTHYRLVPTPSPLPMITDVPLPLQLISPRLMPYRLLLRGRMYPVTETMMDQLLLLYPEEPLPIPMHGPMVEWEPLFLPLPQEIIRSPLPIITGVPLQTPIR